MELTSFFISIQLLVPIIICLCLLILIIVKRKTFYKSRNWLKISSTVFLCVYLLILVSAVYLSNHYKFELQKFDLDGNGSFSVDESTPEQQKAMTLVASDSARNFAFITGLIYASIIALLTYIGGKVFEIFKRGFIHEKL